MSSLEIYFDNFNGLGTLKSHMLGQDLTPKSHLEMTVSKWLHSIEIMSL